MDGPTTDDRFGHAPLIDQRLTWPEHGIEEQRAAERALADHWGMGAVALAAVENRFAQVQGLPTSHAAIAVTNGSHALQLALEALDIGAGDSVIVPALTWQATASAVLDVNAVPVLVDVEATTWTLDVTAIQAYLDDCIANGTTLPKAIIAVHLYQRAAELTALVQMCRRHRIWLVEDCAHAHGGVWNHGALGSFGVIAAFSFQSSKTITCGEGGMVVTGVPALERRLRSLADCGRDSVPTIDASATADDTTLMWRERVEADNVLSSGRPQSGNYRMTGILAAVLNEQLNRFDEQQARRLTGLSDITDRLATLGTVTVPADQPQLTVPPSYKVGFTLVDEHWATLTATRFRRVLSHLLGGYRVDAPYQPLGGAHDQLPELYRPATKRRHHLGADYQSAVDPTAANAPIAHAIYANAVVIEHSFLREPGAGELLTDALTWMHAHTDRLARRGV